MSQIRKIKDMKLSSSSSMSSPSSARHMKSSLAKSTIAAAAAAAQAATNATNAAKHPNGLGEMGSDKSVSGTTKSMGNLTPVKKQVTLVCKEEVTLNICAQYDACDGWFVGGALEVVMYGKILAQLIV